VKHFNKQTKKKYLTALCIFGGTGLSMIHNVLDGTFPSTITKCLKWFIKE